MDISRKPSHRAKSRSKTHILRAEPAVTADTVAVPANLPGARNGALDIGDDAQRHAGEILRLQGLAETQILHQKVRLPCPAAQIMGAIHLHNPRLRAWLGSEERRVGKAGVNTWRSRGSP